MKLPKDDEVRFAAMQALGLLTPLPDLAGRIRPYRVYASYGLLYGMCVNGELPFLRCPRTRKIHVLGDPEEIAATVAARFEWKNGRWMQRRCAA